MNSRDPLWSNVEKEKRLSILGSVAYRSAAKVVLAGVCILGLRDSLWVVEFTTSSPKPGRRDVVCHVGLNRSSFIMNLFRNHLK